MSKVMNEGNLSDLGFLPITRQYLIFEIELGCLQGGVFYHRRRHFIGVTKQIKVKIKIINGIAFGKGRCKTLDCFAV